MRKIKLIRNYYDEGIDLFKNNSITLQQGVTVLVGCNGIGKTTLLRQIKDDLEKNKVPVIKFDNLAKINSCLKDILAQYSSEGENIVSNMIDFVGGLRDFIFTGKVPEEKNPFDILMEDKDEKETDKKEEIKESNERWILLDAIDSGLSIDNVVDMKSFFQTVLNDRPDKDIYIIVSANEYEMARDEQCFDVYNGQYNTFSDYEDYRKFILVSKDWKNIRVKKEEE